MIQLIAFNLKKGKDPLFFKDSTLSFLKHFLSVLNIFKSFVFFLITSGEYLTIYGQGSVFTTDPSKRILKSDPCQNPVKYSPDVHKKETKVLDIFNTEKNMFYKNECRIKSTEDKD